MKICRRCSATVSFLCLLSSSSLQTSRLRVYSSQEHKDSEQPEDASDPEDVRDIVVRQNDVHNCEDDRENDDCQITDVPTISEV